MPGPLPVWSPGKEKRNRDALDGTGSGDPSTPGRVLQKKEARQAAQLPRQLANLTRVGGRDKHGEKQTAGQLGPSRPAHQQLTPTLPPRHHVEAPDWRAVYCITTVHAPPPLPYRSRCHCTEVRPLYLARTVSPKYQWPLLGAGTPAGMVTWKGKKEQGCPGWDRIGRSVHPREGFAKERGRAGSPAA